jgi:hypothetical protein
MGCGIVEGRRCGGLEILCKVGESGQFDEMLAGRGLVDDLVLEDPGEVVGDEDGVEAGAEGGVDVGPRTVADHPGVSDFAGVVGRECDVGVVVLFGQHLDGGEVGGEAGAFKLAGLLLEVSLGDEDESVAGGEIGEGWGNVGEEFDLLISDGLGEAFYAAMLLLGDGDVGELLEAGDQRAAEAMQAISVGEDGRVLDTIEVAADLFGGVDAVIEVRDEAGNGAFEVDVVFPQRVVGVDQQSLIRRTADGLVWELIGGLTWGDHILIIKVVLVGLCYQGAAGMPRLGDITPCRRVPDWKQWLIETLHDLMD